MRLSAGRRSREKVFAASSRVKCRDSEAGAKACRFVALWTFRSLMDSWGIGPEGMNGVCGSMAITALAYGIAICFPYTGTNCQCSSIVILGSEWLGGGKVQRVVI